MHLLLALIQPLLQLLDSPLQTIKSLICLGCEWHEGKSKNEGDYRKDNKDVESGRR
jgi:hypothetical protein